MKLARFTLTAVAAISALSIIIAPLSAKAVSGADFKPGRIIDDSIFTNKNAMNVQQIQNFLNSKVPTCEVWHSAYNASNPPPYTCLKDYSEGGKSAAQIIWDASQAYNINPQVMIVLLQKEQALVTDTWPLVSQFTKATGYLCPDTAACNNAVGGFSKQVFGAAWQFRNDFNGIDTPGFWSVYGKGWNNIRYSPNAACGTKSVYIENQATAVLYKYTPYTPNDSALNNLYGSGDSCGAYGNRNFWRYFNDWFGSTVSGEYLWRVIKAPGDSRLYLQVGNTKRWISTGQLYTDWGLDKYPTNELSQAEFNNIPEIPELTRLGTNGQYNYIVEGGRKHYIPNEYLALWGYQNKIAAPVNSLLIATPENEPMGRFIKATDGTYWLVNGGNRHPISSYDLGAWGYSQNNVVGIDTGYLSQIPIDVAVSRFIDFSGTDYVVDQGGLVRMPSSTVAQAWKPDGYTTIGPLAPSLLPVRAQAGWLIKSTDSPNWFLLNGGNKYYVSNAAFAANWGAGASTLVAVSPEIIAGFTPAGNLTNFAKDTTDQKVYVLDGQKHHVVNGALLSTLTTSASDIINTSSSRLNTINTSEAYTKPLILVRGTPHLYVLDKGKKYHVSTGALSSAYDAWGGYQQLSGTFTDTLPASSSALQSVFKDSTGNFYLADGGKKYQIDSNYTSAWTSPTNIEFSNELIGLMPTSLNAISTRYTKLSGVTYLVDNGIKSRVNPTLIASYVGSNAAFNQANDTLTNNTQDANYLLKSSDDQKVWFINQGTKTEINFAQQVSFGYLSAGLQPAIVSNAFLSVFPNSQNASLLIRKQGSWGIKLVDFGHFLGFPDGDTINSLVSTSNPILIVDDWTYDRFPLQGSVSRIIKDDSGKLYLLENGHRRWITNGNAYYQYRNIAITYLYGTTMALIPEGSPIN